jgi:tryptophan 7-halogenase
MNRIQDVVIVGGGTAGWMTAAALAKVLAPGQPNGVRVTLVESDDIGTIGVGEATIPNIRNFNAALGIDEDDFLRQTQGTFKLGIQFVDWAAKGDAYIHGFGNIGPDLGTAPFYQYWLKHHLQGRAPGIAAYQINTAAPERCKYMRADPSLRGSPLAEIVNAFHFDAGLYARYLRSYSEARGVRRVEGRIVQVQQGPGADASAGHIQAVMLHSGQRVAGDLFVDCSGLRGLLIEETLKAGFEDWSHWLPCDSAVAVPCASAGELAPYTRSTARAAGWQWRIPLQHRTGNGLVYCSALLGADEAASTLMSNLDSAALAEPRHIRFKTGRRRHMWVGNCVAIGLAGGFLEPLESTSIHLIQMGINRLIAFFPHQGFDAADVREFNAQSRSEIERIRDFIILHYKATQRDDAPLWRQTQAMPIPETLQQKIDLYSSNGRLFRQGNELFAESSWLQVMHGQRLRPRSYNPLVDLRADADVAEMLADMQGLITRCLDTMPTHAEFIAQHCAAA